MDTVRAKEPSLVKMDAQFIKATSRKTYQKAKARYTTRTEPSTVAKSKWARKKAMGSCTCKRAKCCTRASGLTGANTARAANSTHRETKYLKVRSALASEVAPELFLKKEQRRFRELSKMAFQTGRVLIITRTVLCFRKESSRLENCMVTA